MKRINPRGKLLIKKSPNIDAFGTIQVQLLPKEVAGSRNKARKSIYI